MSVTRRRFFAAAAALGGGGLVGTAVARVLTPAAVAHATPLTEGGKSIARSLACKVSDSQADKVEACVRQFGAKWLESKGDSPDTASEYLRYIQEATGLPQTGLIDPNTVAVVLHSPRCGCPDPLPENDRADTLAARWGKSDLAYFIEARDGDLPPDRWDAEMRTAFDRWEAVAGVRFRIVDTKSAADIVVSVGTGRGQGFDGPSGVLAWAELPPNDRFQGQLLTRFDTGETWRDQRGVGGIILRAVACHEFGHLLGLEHSRIRSALMAPYYSPGVLCPQQSDDIPRIQALYGPPADKPNNPGQPPEIPGGPNPMPPPGGPNPEPPGTRPGGPDTDPGCTRTGINVRRVICYR